MKKFICLTAAFALFTIFGAMAQSGGIKAVIVDAETQEVVNGAEVEYFNANTPNSKKYEVSSGNGNVNIKSLRSGTYQLNIRFLGYTDLTKEVKVGSSVVDLGKIELKSDAQQIESVAVEVQAMRTSQKGDTVVYNAAAFKVTADADAASLLSKMPGITVNSDGSVNAQGERVGRVFVDGKEFFGEDVATTLNTIPAEMVGQIEVYDKLSDRAEFMGIDDGNGYKAINIVTAADKKIGVFGRVSSMYGFDDKYYLGGNANIFDDKQRVSVTANFNNINRQDFSFSDILGAIGGGGGGRIGGQSGLSTIQSAGANYSTETDKMDLQLSYSFSNIRNRNYTTRDSENFTNSEVIQLVESVNSSASRNQSHSVSGLFNYNFNSRNRLRLRPNFSIQNNNSNSYSTSKTQNRVGSETPTLVNERLTKGNNDGFGLSGSMTALWMTRISDKGTTITIDASMNIGDNRSNSLPEQYIFNTLVDLDKLKDMEYDEIIDKGNPFMIYNQKNDSRNKTMRIGSNFSLNHPISQKVQLSFEYRFNYNNSDSKRNSYMWLPGVLDFDPNIDPDLSNIYLNRNFTHNIGPSLSIRTGLGNISAGMTYQLSDMHSERKYPQSSQGTIERTFHDFSYNVNARLNLNRQNMLNISASSSTSNPSITQLQDVTDVSSLSNITSGNPNLKPTFSNNARLNYTFSNIAAGRTFMVSANVSNAINSIVDSLVINQPDFIIPATGEKLGAGNQFVKPVNLNGRWNASTSVSYGFPVNFIKSNFTINGGASISESPSIINGDINTMQTVTYNGGVQIGSNVSEYVDFTVRYNGSYSISTNSSELRARNNNKYFNQSASAQLRWIFWKGITFTGNVSYSQYKGITTDYNTETTLINIYFGKKLFKSQRGELSIGVNDLLDQNKAFSRSVSATSISNSTSMVMGRYVAVQFIYNIRSFQASSANGARFSMGGGGRGGFDSLGGGRPGGMGGGRGGRR